MRMVVVMEDLWVRHPMVTYGGGGRMMVWGCFCLAGTRIFVNAEMNAFLPENLPVAVKDLRLFLAGQRPKAYSQQKHVQKLKWPSQIQT